MEYGIEVGWGRQKQCDSRITIGILTMKRSPEEYVAYKGEKFTIEWYFDKEGRSESKEYYSNLDEAQQEKLHYLFQRLGELGKIWDITKFRSEGDKLFAFKENQDRLLCFFFIGKKVIITHAFTKKSDKLPEKEKRKALIRMCDYEERIRRGAYYE